MKASAILLLAAIGSQYTPCYALAMDVGRKVLVTG